MALKSENLADHLKFSRLGGMSIAEIQKMSQVERLSTMEALWDAICHENKEPSSPDWHGDLLEERRSKIASGRATFVSLDEAKKRIQG